MAPIFSAPVSSLLHSLQTIAALQVPFTCVLSADKPQKTPNASAERERELEMGEGERES